MVMTSCYADGVIPSNGTYPRQRGIMQPVSSARHGAMFGKEIAVTTVDHMKLTGDILPLSAFKWVTGEHLRQLGLYHCDIIVNQRIPLERKRINEIRQAEQAGIVRRNSDVEIACSYLVLHALRESDNQPIWVVFEASFKIKKENIELARQRADILSAVYEEPALAVVVGENIDDRDRTRASDAGVAVINIRHQYRPES